MAKLPREPDLDILRATAPSLITTDSLGLEPLHRIYNRGGPHPTLWNQLRFYGPLSRFDHHFVDSAGDPMPQDRGILYAATDIPTAVAEFFQRNRRRINRTRKQPWLASFPLDNELCLLNLTDAFCLRIGASMKLMSGPFSHAQNWSRGFYEAYPQIHGLYYPSSLTNKPIIALYERVVADTGALQARTKFHRALADPVMHKPLTIIAEQIGYGLI